MGKPLGLWIGGKREQKEVAKNESGLAMLSSANLLSRLGLLRFGVMRVTSDDRKMINAANRLHKALDRAFSHDNCPFSMELARELEVFRSAAAHLRWSYPVLCELQTVTPKERLATMFSGPLYTSDLHPWPVDKRGQATRTYVPDRSDNTIAVIGFDAGRRSASVVDGWRLWPSSAAAQA